MSAKLLSALVEVPSWTKGEAGKEEIGYTWGVAVGAWAVAVFGR